MFVNERRRKKDFRNFARRSFESTKVCRFVKRLTSCDSSSHLRNQLRYVQPRFHDSDNNNNSQRAPINPALTSRKIPYFSRLMTIATRRNDENDHSSNIVSLEIHHIYIYIKIYRVIGKILSLLRKDCVDRRMTTQRDKNRFIKIPIQIPRASLVLFPSRYPLLDSR